MEMKNATTIKNALARFVAHLVKEPHCNDKNGTPLLKQFKPEALKHRLIALNIMLKKYLVFDLDFSNAESKWHEVGLPSPTIICVNPENTHAHLFYGLKEAVSFRNNKTGLGDARQKPMEYYKRVYDAMREILRADVKYTRYICKNPLHPD